MKKIILIIGLTLHIAVAIWNGFYGPSFGAEGDALNFHYEALKYANNLSDYQYSTGWVYAYVLGIVYRYSFAHIFAGSMISVFAWFISAIFFIKTIDLIDCKDKRSEIFLLLYSLWPSAILNTSVTLRESFQLLSVNYFIFGTLSYLLKGKFHWSYVAFGVVMGSALHGALLAFFFMAGAYFVYNAARERLKLSFAGGLLAMTFLGGAMLFLGFSLLSNIAYNLDSGLASAVQTYNEGAITANARADYRSNVQINGIIGLIQFIPISLFQFMLEPLPTRIQNISDFFVFLENLLRLYLIALVFRSRKYLTDENKSGQNFALFLYISISILWAMGTVNWGTASRHHVVGLGLLLVAAYFPKNRKYAQFRS